MIYHYPPTLTPDAIEYAPMQGAAPPPAHVGYRIDPLNPWRQTSEWRPCSARQVGMRPRKCGRALLTMICNCERCPLKGRIIKPDDCEDCDNAQSPHLIRDNLGEVNGKSDIRL